MGNLILVPIFLGEREELLPALGRSLADRFHASVRVRRPWFDAEDAFDANRGQYHSTKLLEFLLTLPEPEAEHVIGVAGVDLFIPVLTYVFGEAQLKGRAAVVSLYRLQNEVYGLRADPPLLISRLEKESIHELGHTLGLVHCHEAECVMHSSTYVEDIDLKGSVFCPQCRAKMEGSKP